MANTVRINMEVGRKIRELLTFCYSNGLSVPSELKRIYNPNQEFLESELEELSIYITDKGLSLQIGNVKCQYSKGLDNSKIQYILSQIPIAKTLEVSYSEMESIDLSNLKRLESLYINSNLLLKKIEGLSTLGALKQFEFCGNSAYDDIDKIVDFSTKLSSNMAFVSIDSLYYPKFNNLNTYLSNIEFCESVGSFETQMLRYPGGILSDIYGKAMEYNKYIMDNDTPEQKFAIFYALLINDIYYDYDYLKKREAHLKSSGLKGGRNGLYNGFRFKKTVCEGYVHMLQLLLNMNSIRSYDVHCVAGSLEERQKGVVNHSIIAVDLGYGMQYSDITFDSENIHMGKNVEYFLLCRNDMNKTHIVDLKLPSVDSNSSISDKKRTELFSFASERIKEVNMLVNIEKEIQEKFGKRFNLNNIDDLYKAKGYLIRIGKLSVFDSQSKKLELTLASSSKTTNETYGNGKCNEELPDLVKYGEYELPDRVRYEEYELPDRVRYEEYELPDRVRCGEYELPDRFFGNKMNIMKL